MATVKTAISLDESLFARVEELACEMQVSRSRLVALALEEFVRRRENQQLLEQINAAYEDSPETDEEREFIRAAGRHFRELLDNERE